MAKEIHLFGKKKDAYPTKTTINFYIKEDKSTGVSTVLLYVIFAAVVLFALCKWFIFDLTNELQANKTLYETNQVVLEKYEGVLENYDKINQEYNRYSYSYLTENDKIQDRMDVLKMLEQTIFRDSIVRSVTISDDMISASLTEIDLEGTSQLAKKLEGYDMVKSVTVNTASYGGTYTSNMVITLNPEENTAGGTK